MSGANPFLAGLPPELRIQILGYALSEKDIIDITHDEIRSLKFPARWCREIELMRQLKDTSWKPSRKRRTAVLETCRELHHCGMSALGGGNTFSFNDYVVLIEFLRAVKLGVKSRIKSVLWDVNYGNPAYAVDEQTKSDWSQQLTVSLGSLLKLGSLRQLGITFRSLLLNPDVRMACYRDTFVKAVPEAVFANLKFMRITCHYTHRPASSIDILEYARDVSSGHYDACPIEVQEDAGPVEQEDRDHPANMWREARAAKHWNYKVPAGSLAHVEKSWQWSTWAREWRGVDVNGFSTGEASSV